MKISKRQLRQIVQEETVRSLQEMTDDEHFNTSAGGVIHTAVNVEDEYVKLIKELGPRSFIKRLMWAFGDMSGHPGGHASIIKWIKENS